MTIQTWAFVAFNKVMTFQYFLWFVALVPFVAVNNQLFHKYPLRASLMQIFYLYPVIWGHYAFKFEFMGENTFADMQLWNVVFFFYNILCMIVLSRYHTLTISFESEGSNTIEAQ